MFKLVRRDLVLGAGIGLIISGLLVSLSGTGQLSDEQVMARAEKLGMVQKKEAGEGQSAPGQETPQTQKPKSVKTGAAGTSPEVQLIDDKVPFSEKGQGSPGGTDLAAPQQAAGAVTIEVKPGMGSDTVIRLLEQKGAVSDTEELYKVMTKYNAHSKLKVGTFKIPAGTDMKGIVDILTGKAKTN